MKKRLTQSEEFEIMKLVLDKILWLGTIILGVGLYEMLTTRIVTGAYFLITGVVILAVFAVLVVKEYEMIK